MITGSLVTVLLTFRAMPLGLLLPCRLLNLLQISVADWLSLIPSRNLLQDFSFFLPYHLTTAITGLVIPVYGIFFLDFHREFVCRL